MDRFSNSLSIYVHWPFCQSKCPYCDFNSHVRKEPIDQDKFLEAYKRELDYISNVTNYSSVRSIFFGGGTPSLMSAQTVDEILNSISQKWSLDQDVEISLEANPSSVEIDRFQAYRDAGVNRISIGVQSLYDHDLKSLGRLHTSEEAIRAIGIATEIYDRVSFDLIYARPSQSPKDWEKELSQALKYCVGHLSLYQLTIEPDTRFYDLYHSGKLKVPSGGLAEEHYLITQELCEAAGLKAYEVSNHALPGQECIHNLVYWSYGSYAGIGPGAHGRINIHNQRTATSMERNPEVWCDKVMERENGIVFRQDLSPTEQADEMLLMGLRLEGGLDLSKLRELTGYIIDINKISDFLDQELIILQPNNFLSVSSKGRFVLDYIIGEVSSALVRTKE